MCERSVSDMLPRRRARDSRLRHASERVHGQGSSPARYVRSRRYRSAIGLRDRGLSGLAMAART